MSTPFRINIAYGQQTLFTFLFFLFPFLYNTKSSIILSGLSYFKYNLGYVIFLYFASLRNLKNLLLSSIPFVIGWLTYSYITKTEPFRNLIEPILILEYFLSKEDHLPVTIFSLISKIDNLKFLGFLIPLALSILVIYKSKILITIYLNFQ